MKKIVLGCIVACVLVCSGCSYQNPFGDKGFVGKHFAKKPVEKQKPAPIADMFDDSTAKATPAVKATTTVPATPTVKATPVTK